MFLVIFFNYSFLASMGGLLGFCTGFSLLSAVELIYWFTVRILNDYFHRKKVSAQPSQNKEKCEKVEDDLKTRMDNLESKMEELAKMREELRDMKDYLRMNILWRTETRKIKQYSIKK